MSSTSIERDTVVAFSYVLKDESGTEIERSETASPIVYLHGHRNLLPGIEEVLSGKSTGDHVSVTLPPERAYGLRRENAFQRIPIKHLLTKAKRFRPGMVVKVNTREGPRDVVVVKAGKFNVDVDLNHPLAGKTVTFDMTVEQVREATAEELAHGHAHGVEGHDHHH